MFRIFLSAIVDPSLVFRTSDSFSSKIDIIENKSDEKNENSQDKNRKITPSPIKIMILA